MKPDKHFAIVYDDQCPLCSAYSRWFVRLKWIQPVDRISFSEIAEYKWSSLIDMSRARNEIPVAELQSGTVFYGVEGLAKIFAQRFPVIEKVAMYLPVNYFLTRLYKIISFNRRIVMPAKACHSKFDCSPDFNLKYRLLFIILSTIISFIITFLFGTSVHEMISDSRERSGFYFLLIAGTGWVLLLLFSILRAGVLSPSGRVREGSGRFNALLENFFLQLSTPPKSFPKGRTWLSRVGMLSQESIPMKSGGRVREGLDYISHLSVIMLAGVLVLIPSIVINFLSGQVILPVTILSLCISGGVMFLQHRNRVRLLGISKWWNTLWLLSLYGGAFFCILFLQV